VTGTILRDEFLEAYKEKQPPFGSLGLMVYLRTYSRYLPEEGRRERWWETVKRVVEYSFSLTEGIAEYDDKEVERLYDHIFNLRLFPAGRTLWIGGTDVVKDYPEANFNCSFRVIDSIDAYAEIFHMLLVGCGTGFSVERKYTQNLPRFNKNVAVTHIHYRYLGKEYAYEDTKLRDKGAGRYLLIVGDSKEGWEESLRQFLTLLTKESTVEVKILYDHVRPAGTRLKRFGGRASGPAPLRKMFEKIHDFIEEDGILSPVDAMDICNTIAEAVVVGGVRRSSQIALGDVDNYDFIDAKFNLFSDPLKKRFKDSRSMSNNSVMLYENPGVEYFKEILARIAQNGEPGFINMESMLQRNPFAKGCNPCAEIALDDKQLCNLVEVVVLAFVRADGTFDWQGFEEAVECATEMASRITTVTLWDEAWDEVQKRDRLLGVSLTGIVEAFHALDWNFEQQEEFFRDAKKCVRGAADVYHEYLGIPRSLLVTTIKPSGTLSQLPTVSSGIHAPYAPYYMRRVRVSSHDPLAKALRDMGYPCSPENGQGDDLEFCTTWVFSFAVKTNAKFRAIDESALTQLERYQMAMDNYVEHNCSVTISFRPFEIDAIAEWLSKDENWKSYVGVSFLPAFDDSNSPYPLMPYQTCTEEAYNQYWSHHKPMVEDELIGRISQYEKEADEYSLEQDCSSGSCPVR
jgi:ribonucleoside-diphosphate reductase alpha chain/ribonucleoside-triphosphate reductase